MSFKNKKVPYSTVHSSTILMAREDDQTAPDAAAAEAARVSAANAAQAAAIQKAVDEAVFGLKTKNDELIGKVKTANERAKLFDGLDPVKLKEMQERLDADDDAKLFAEGKKHEVIDKHTQRMRADYDEKLRLAEERVKDESKRADTYRASVLDAQILSVTNGLHKGAVEDALLHARNLFTLDAKGRAVQLEADGKTPVIGKDGVTPFSPAEWLETQKEMKPHWFPATTTGSGSGSAREASGSGNSIRRSDFDKLPGHEQAKVATSGTQIID